MREIKFRGKNYRNGEWIYGSYIPPDYSYAWLEPSIVNLNNRLAIDPETLGQYTGFKDLYGTEIYDGDILKLPDEPDVGSIVVRFGENEGTLWGRQNYGFYVTFVIKKFNEINRQDFLFWYRKGVTVIGNIYDNPEEGK